MVIIFGSNALALIITVTVPVFGTVVVICKPGVFSLGLDGTDIHPPSNTREINTMSRIAYFLIKERMNGYLIILFP
jgi:hypothetical protein